MRRFFQFAALVSATIVLGPAARPAPQARTGRRDDPAAASETSATPENENLARAVCPVVYQLDDSPGTRGYHYIFYGNAFFINRDGYLLTAAHVVSEFRDGGHPSILVRSAVAPPRLVKVTVVAIDLDHDVAILRASPNPFGGAYAVAALPLASERPAISERVGTIALRPSRAKDPHTFELPIEDSYPATVLDYHSMSLTPESKSGANPQSLSGPQELTNLFLFSHEVQRGQSGAPVISATTGQVVGIIEGRWLHPAGGSLAKMARGIGPASPPSLTQGAAVPITYALALLEKSRIGWSAGPQ